MNRTVTTHTTMDNLRLRLFMDGYERLVSSVFAIKRAAVAGKLRWTSTGLKAPGIDARPYERQRNALLVKAIASGKASDAAKWAAERAGIKVTSWPVSDD